MTLCETGQKLSDKYDELYCRDMGDADEDWMGYVAEDTEAAQKELFQHWDSCPICREVTA